MILFLFYVENLDVKEEHILAYPLYSQSDMVSSDTMMAVHSFDFQLDVELSYILHLTFHTWF